MHPEQLIRKGNTMPANKPGIVRLVVSIARALARIFVPK